MSLPKTAAGVSSAPSGLVGKTIAGRFEIEVQLGAGGMGEVYRATDTRLKRTVALKRVAPGLLVDARYTERLQSEAELASVLNSPNISAIHDAFQSEGEMFLVMEYVEGVNLRQRLLQPLPLDEFLGIAVQCASALAAAQAKGIVHGDIKPENIMLTPSGQAKVLDFGVARRMPEEGTTLDALAASRWLAGTPAYLAPEVLLAKHSDTRADIFALGVVFYESLSGRHPFHAESFLAIANRILQETPPPLMASNPKLPAELDRVVSKMLAKDPADRYATAADLGVDLRGLQKATPLAFRQSAVLPQPAAAEPAARKAPAALRGLKWPLAAVLGIALLAALFLLTRLGRSPIGSNVPSSPISAIAVLPLKNISGDPKQDYFAEGLTDALTSELASIGSLRVISRTSAMLYRAANKSVPQIAKELKVDAVIEGSVERSGDRVKISASLIQTSPERTLWSRPYERDLRDILTLEGEVARDVAQQVNAHLSKQEQSRLAGQRPPVDPAAYENYLRGRAEWNKRTEEGLRNALQYFRAAIARDSGYAPAWAGIAETWQSLSDYRVLPPKEALAQALTAARKALELDDSLGEAHAALAWIRVSSLEFTGAEEEFKRAIDLNPNYPTAHHHYALYLAAMDRNDEALKEINRAQELDPLSTIVNANVVWCLFLARRFDQAIATSRSALAIDPNFSVAHEYLGQIYVEKKMYSEAISEFEEAIHSSNGAPAYEADLGYASALKGDRPFAESVLRRLNEQSRRNYVSPYEFAEIYAGLGRNGEAVVWLEKAYDDRTVQLMNLKVHPWFQTLHQEPKFQGLLRRIGLSKDSPKK